MKRFLTILMSLVCLFGIIPFASFSAIAGNTEAKPEIRLSSTVVKKGSSFYLNLYAKNLVNCTSGAVFVLYDTEAFDFVGETGAGTNSYPDDFNIVVQKIHPEYNKPGISCVFMVEKTFSTNAILLAQLEFISNEEVILNKDYDFNIEIDQLFAEQDGKNVDLSKDAQTSKGAVKAVEYISSKDIFEYTINEGEVIITGLKGSHAYVEIPEKIDGASVVEIAEKAFLNNKDLTNLIIHGNMLEIAPNAFDGCSNLERIDVQNIESLIQYYSSDTGGVLYIHDSQEDINLKSLFHYPAASKQTFFSTETLRALDKNAFSGSQNLKTIFIDKDMKNISDEALTSLPKLSNIIVSDENADYLSENGVLYNKNKTSLIRYPSSKTDQSFDIAASVEKITAHTFEGVPYLRTITVNKANKRFMAEAGVLFSKDKKKLLYYPGGKTEPDYTLPDSVTSIEDLAFSSNLHIKNLYTQKSVMNFGLNFNYLSVPSGLHLRPKGDWIIWVHADSYADAFVKSQAENLDFAYYASIPKEQMLGDLNDDGKVTASDARLALRASARLENLTDAQFAAADVNKDGQISAVDARIILRVSAKLQSFD